MILYNIKLLFLISMIIEKRKILYTNIIIIPTCLCSSYAWLVRLTSNCQNIIIVSVKNKFFSRQKKKEKGLAGSSFAYNTKRKPFPVLRKHQCQRLIDAIAGPKEKTTVAIEPPVVAHQCRWFLR